MIGTFLMISTSSITVQSFGKIILSTRVRMRKCGVCMFFVTLRVMAGRSLEWDIL